MNSAEFGSPLRKYKLVFLGEQSGKSLKKELRKKSIYRIFTFFFFDFN